MPGDAGQPIGLLRLWARAVIEKPSAQKKLPASRSEFVSIGIADVMDRGELPPNLKIGRCRRAYRR